MYIFWGVGDRVLAFGLRYVELHNTEFSLRVHFRVLGFPTPGWHFVVRICSFARESIRRLARQQLPMFNCGAFEARGSFKPHHTDLHTWPYSAACASAAVFFCWAMCGEDLSCKRDCQAKLYSVNGFLRWLAWSASSASGGIELQTCSTHPFC